MTAIDSERSQLANAVDLNNEATLQIVKGEYPSAINTLSNALVHMKTAIKEGTIAPAGAASQFSSMKGQPLHFVHDAQQARPAPSQSPSDDSEEWYLFREPVRVCPNTVPQMGLSVEIISYGIIYNLALSHHLEALLTKEVNIAQLQRAASFYGHAQKLLTTHNLDVDMGHGLVIANNLGHAHHFLNNEPSAKVCFQRLLNAIMYISESGEEGRQILSSDGERFDGFLVNITMLLIGTPCSAPAA